MRVAISSDGNTPDSKIDRRFGRCAYFVIYDTESKAIEYIPNPNLSMLEGAGPASTNLLVSRGVKMVISGEFGVKVKSIFDSLQIQLVVFKYAEKRVNEILVLLDHKN